MQGFLAVTNPDWYERLARSPGPKDANFWRPSTRRTNLPIGTPFIFKLKGRPPAVVGFGYFAGTSVMPDWLAWDTFGEANGVESLDALRTRLSSIRNNAGIESNPLGLIGCALVAEALFFPRDRWIDAPSDWRDRSQTGMSYDLSAGEGERIWLECMARAGGQRPSNDVLALREHERFGAPVVHLPRLGQHIFRIRVLDAYGRACAVSGEHSLPALEAVHIKPYAQGGEHAVANGLVMRSDIHRLFDRGYVAVDPERRFVVSRRLKDDFENGHSYFGFAGKEISTPAIEHDRPSALALEWHQEHVFLG